MVAVRSPEGLLHAIADAVVVVLRLNDRQRDAGLVIQDVFGPFGRGTADQLALDDHAAISERNLLPYLWVNIPSGPL